ncbi:MAG: phenylalanine--tRNA ligase subunit beta [Acidobacteria bacterium]|nr:phenylalanine--tRNA ligase subunit beta [Acidobacteriota bacterium]
MAGDPRERDGGPGGSRGGRLRPRAAHRLGLRHRRRPDRDSEVPRARHPRLLRQRPASSGAVRAVKILVSWLREFVPVTASIEELADSLTRHGFEVASIDPAPDVPGRPAGEPDAVLDLEVTTNRPDCLSVVGIAREVSTIYGEPLALPVLADGSVADGHGAAAGGDDPLPVTIESDALDLCPRYAASLAGVTIGPSPAWMAARLEAVDIRPINNLVDITNYVLIEMGHPLHAFDLDRLRGGELRIRRARAGESVTTLDGIARTLEDDMLVIADATVPQAVAGVMGSADSEVAGGTRRVAFESAWFDPISVRRTGRRLALSTEASYRFERGADITAPVRAMRRAQELLVELGAGAPEGAIVDRYPAPRTRPTVTLRHARIGRVLGVEVDRAFVPAALGRLGFDVDDAPAAADASGDADAPANDTWRVTVPGHRVDVSREIDLIEEVARHYGYDRLPSTFPAMAHAPAPESNALAQQRLARRVLTASTCSEAVTYGFIEESAARPFVERDDEIVRIANPLSEHFAVLRPSLLPGLIGALVYNRHREHHDIRLFEIGARFTASGGEVRSVGIALTGSGTAGHWSGEERPSDFFDLTGIVSRLCDAFGVHAGFEPLKRPTLVPGRAATVVAPAPGGGAPRPLGAVGQLAFDIAEQRGIHRAGAEAVWVAELDLDGLAAAGTDRRRMVTAPLPRYPSSVRDLAVVVDAALPAASVRGTIRSAAPETLLAVHEFDRYEGKGIPRGCVSLAFRLTFRAADRTLTDPEVQQAMDSIVGALQTAHGATLR